MIRFFLFETIAMQWCETKYVLYVLTRWWGKQYVLQNWIQLGSKRTSCLGKILDADHGKDSFSKKDTREETLEYKKYAIGIFKEQEE